MVTRDRESTRPPAKAEVHEPDDAGLYLSARYLRGLVEYVRAKAATLDPVLQALGLSERQLSQPDAFIRHGAQDLAFAAAEHVTGDTNVGLHAGEAVHLLHFGIVGQLAVCCQTGRDLLDIHLRYQGLIGNGLRTVCTRTPREVIVEFVLERRAPSRHSIDYTLAAQLTLARLLAGPEFKPLAYELTYPEPAHAEEHRRVFQCPVRFGAPTIRAIFPPEVEALQLAGGEPGIAQVLELAARQRLESLRVQLPHADSQLERYQQYIADRLSSGGPDLEQTASAMGMSVRSLQRRLSTHGLSYRELVESVRRRVTERLLVNPSLSLLDIALLVGFSDQSSFNRAFRRWFATTPSRLRLRQAAEREEE
jgi:AraC-like DNA-binding protein